MSDVGASGQCPTAGQNARRLISRNRLLYIKQILKKNRQDCNMHDDIEYQQKLGKKLDELAVLVSDIFGIVESARKRLDETKHRQKLTLIKRIKNEDDGTEQ